MSVAVWVGKKAHQMGTASFLKSFFSTVSVRLEGGDWGSRYPVLMKEFYWGQLKHEHCGKAAEELKDVRESLAAFPPEQIVWDFENLEAKPPWGDYISPTITSLANYFWTADGKDLIEVLLKVFKTGARTKQDVKIM